MNATTGTFSSAFMALLRSAARRVRDIPTFRPTTPSSINGEHSPETMNQCPPAPETPRAPARTRLLKYYRATKSSITNMPPKNRYKPQRPFSPQQYESETSTLDRVGVLGQPTPQSHPHLLQHGHLTRGISKEEYEFRRKQLMERVEHGSVVLVPGYGMRYKANGIFYPFTQSSQFFYLCGLVDPDAALVLIRDTHVARGYRMILYTRKRDPETALWDGPRTGVEGALEWFDADEAYPSSEFAAHLPQYLSHCITHKGSLYTDLSIEPMRPVFTSHNAHQHHPSRDPSISALFTSLDLAPLTPFLSQLHIQPLKPKVDQLRLFKSDAEIKNMRLAGKIAGKSMIELIKTLPTLKLPVSESIIQSILSHHAILKGADSVAYVPVVAGGNRGLTLHYTHNNQLIHENEMVLIDFGVDVGGYASDITRTIPISGKFTSPQKDIYSLVLEVQRNCIKQCTLDSKKTLDEIHQYAMKELRDGLSYLCKRKIGITEMQNYFPHHLSHYLGLDVHDTEVIYKSRRLEPGMVVTIEPGLYLPPSSNIPHHFHNIAVRIEDDIVVGETGHTILSVEAPKEVSDIEALYEGITAKYAGSMD